jgi:hypothetical protein
LSQSPNRLLGIFLGVIYLLAGILGFFLTSSTGFAATSGPRLLDLFEVNPLFNVVHLVIGAALLIAGLVGARPARVVGLVAGAIFLVIAVAGLFIGHSGNSLDFLALNGADTVLDFASAAVLLAVGIGADRGQR